MNLTLSDTLLGRQRSRQWTPLVTQQYRLRHVHQIFGLNFPHLPKKGTYYFTLHLTTMSAPFYTSEKLDSWHPKWPELDQRNLTNLAATAFVLRVWQHIIDKRDVVISTWGINLSGLVYLGNKIAEIQPAYFNPNTVIFNIRGGFFTSHHVVNRDGSKPPPFIDNLNLMEAGDGNKQIFRKTTVQAPKTEIRNSYNINKLRKLHSLQVTIRNKSLDVQGVREKIEIKVGMDGLETQSVPETPHSSSPSNIRYAPQLLTMKSVNKMLEEKPTKMQRREMVKMRNEIEVEQFKSKLLSQERDKKSALIRRFKNKLKSLVDSNEKKNLELMENYYKLSKETEKLRDLKKSMAPTQELLITLHSQLYHRRRQLLQQLLFIYPIQQVNKKFTIHGIYVPNSDILSDCSDAGISVALGYITHVLLMSSMFLQVPLRYPMTHYGSRSYITDHVSPILPEKERDFPLFTKGKEKIQFTYAVYLLNKNIAQLRWLFFMHTPELKATLPNLLSFLEGKDFKETLPLVTCNLGIKNEIENVRKTFVEENIKISVERHQELPKKYNKMYRSCECGPGLSEILAIPEAFMNKQISSDSFKNYIASKKLADQSSTSIIIKEGRVDENNKNCDNNEVIEQGTDLLDPSVNLSILEENLTVIVETCPKESSNDETNQSTCLNGDQQTVESSCDDSNIPPTVKMDDSQTELLEKWMKNGTECCSQEDFQTNEDFSSKTISISAVQSLDSPLMARTDALLNTKSFNLVKPKPNL